LTDAAGKIVPARRRSIWTALGAAISVISQVRDRSQPIGDWRPIRHRA
jgi:hypothetical protein